MENTNPFTQAMPQPHAYRLPGVAVPWFEIDSCEPHNLRAHQEQTPGQEAYIGEQYAQAEKAYRDADDENDRAFARAFIRARQTFIKRLSKKGGEEAIDVSDTTAKYLAYLDPEVIKTTAALNAARFERDRWKGYQKSMGSKVSLLLCLSGVHRDELRSLRGG